VRPDIARGDRRASTRAQLNPSKAAPVYIFEDHRLVVQASGHVGDADWAAFVDHMEEPGAPPPGEARPTG